MLVGHRGVKKGRLREKVKGDQVYLERRRDAPLIKRSKSRQRGDTVT